MALTDILQGLLEGATAQLLSSSQPAPGAPVDAAVAGLPGDLELSDVISGDMDLTWVGKEVMFDDADVEPSFLPADLDASTIGAKPFTGATGVIGGVSGVPGLLGQLKGKIPLPLQGKFPLQVSVSWRVLDQDHNDLPADQFSAPTGLVGAHISVAFAPEVTELTDGDPPLPRRRYLRATVSLSANGVTVGPRDLPDLPVLVPAIPIPTVLAMFVHTNFQPRQGDDDGAALIVVPEHSPLRSLTQLQQVLNTLDSTVGSLQSFAGFASFLLGLGDLVSALNVQIHVQFRAADRIDNLNDITLIQNSWYENDIEAEDELSSLILIGPTNRGAKCSNARDQHDNEGQFVVRTGGSMCAVIRDLDGKHPSVEFGSIQVTKEPPGGLFNPDKFNDELSSVEFV